MDRKKAGVLLAAGALGLALIIPTTASAVQPDSHDKVTICHRTNSVTNPYVLKTVNAKAIDGVGKSDHQAHLGPVFDVTVDPSEAYPPPRNGDQWGDIIPPFYADGETPTELGSLNWDATGQAIFADGCEVPAFVTTTSEETSDETTDATSTSDEVLPEGSVEAITPPSTDGMAAPTASSTVPTGLLLTLAGLLGAALVAIPAATRTRR